MRYMKSSKIILITIAVILVSILIYSINSTESRTINNTISEDNHQESSNVSQIIPGPSQLKLCRSIPYGPMVSIINSSGFQEYNFSGIYNYVITPGHQGTIKYKIERETFVSDIGSQIQKEINIVNAAAFTHFENVTVEPEIKQKEITLVNGTHVLGFETCYTAPGMDETCYSGTGNPPSKTIKVEVPRTDHPGISASFEPQSEVTRFGTSSTITMTIKVDANVSTGTYWFAAPTSCNSPQILLTIGTQPYNETLKTLKL